VHLSGTVSGRGIPPAESRRTGRWAELSASIARLYVAGLRTAQISSIPAHTAAMPRPGWRAAGGLLVSSVAVLGLSFPPDRGGIGYKE
jgi:hypothetical protein